MKTKIVQKIGSLVLALVMAFSIGSPAFAASAEPNRSNGIEFIEKNVTATSAYLQYYLTVDGKTTLIKESAKVKNNIVSADISSVEIDENSNPLTSTQKVDHLTMPIVKHSPSTNSSTELQSELRSNYKWHPYSTTYSLAGAKFTVVSVAVFLAAASGMGLAPAVSVATNILSGLSYLGESAIPDSVYFEGERCVSQSDWKMYYRYKGNFYLDSSKEKLLARNVSWSRRWGS